MLRTEIDRCLKEEDRNGKDQRLQGILVDLSLTCFEMTSGDRGVNFDGSMSIFGTVSTTSSSSDSESDSSCVFLSVSSPGIVGKDG